ncbi:hypothetical protein Bbelb_005670 [Branchiostoma belcheri]|nr:hypothetical protein Bbelb_005670 [Branchiostoma belcheri]
MSYSFLAYSMDLLSDAPIREDIGVSCGLISVSVERKLTRPDQGWLSFPPRSTCSVLSVIPARPAGVHHFRPPNGCLVLVRPPNARAVLLVGPSNTPRQLPDSAHRPDMNNLHPKPQRSTFGLFHLLTTKLDTNKPEALDTAGSERPRSGIIRLRS